MKQFIIETDLVFRMSNVYSFDSHATGSQILSGEMMATSIWSITTTLMPSQILLIKGIIRVGRLTV